GTPQPPGSPHPTERRWGETHTPALHGAACSLRIPSGSGRLPSCTAFLLLREVNGRQGLDGVEEADVPPAPSLTGTGLKRPGTPELCSEKKHVPGSRSPFPGPAPLSLTGRVPPTAISGTGAAPLPPPAGRRRHYPSARRAAGGRTGGQRTPGRLPPGPIPPPAALSSGFPPRRGCRGCRCRSLPAARKEPGCRPQRVFSTATRRRARWRRSFIALCGRSALTKDGGSLRRVAGGHGRAGAVPLRRPSPRPPGVAGEARRVLPAPQDGLLRRGGDKDLQFHIVKQARAQSVKEGTGYSEGSYSLLPVEVPQNHKRFTCDLTQADRLALYDYVVEETKKQRSRSQITENDSDLFVDLAAKITQDDSQKGPKSHLEILAEMRDYKRRRQSYRAKNVHITKKSYTEVIRDVIGVHMEELSNHWQEENRLDNAEICEGGKSKSSGRKEDRRSASVDSRQSGGSCKDTERSRHRREASRSPNKRKRSRERGKERDSRRKRERDEDKYHSHKRRK
uniref:Small nuclear ribonucleoprotein U11/U12 subunit 48 n=1 Tax=Aquila chrysaetos chrysaetos TaxID=223781 RepID=A0A663F3K8_AQUCH